MLHSGNSAYRGVDVKDVTILIPNQAAISDTNYTASQCVLSATWSVDAGAGTAPTGYEWSVGIKGYQPGSGVLDLVNDPIWRDAMITEETAVFTMDRSKGI